MTPEFSRPLRLDQIGTGESQHQVAADEAELAALAARFALVVLDRLEADYAVRRDAVGVIATGRLRANASQSCVVTGRPVPAAIDQPFTLRFQPEPGDDAGEEVELDADDCDTVFFTGGTIDLGEAAAQTLLLALDPFPRASGADKVLREAGVLSEDEAGPFAGLAALRDKLNQK